VQHVQENILIQNCPGCEGLLNLLKASFSSKQCWLTVGQTLHCVVKFIPGIKERRERKPERFFWILHWMLLIWT